MRRPASMNLMERDVRQAICRDCPRRPAGSERWGPTVPRACEPECALFVHLPRLKYVAERVDPMVGYRPGVLRHCVDDVIRTCRREEDAISLRLNREELVQIIDRAVAGTSAAGAAVSSGRKDG